MKNCKNSQCSRVNPQPLSNFAKHKTSKDGVDYFCKRCKRLKDPRYKLKKRKLQKLKVKPYSIFKKDHCEKCPFTPTHSCQLDVDHIDGNHTNNDPSNLITLCANCHRLKTYIERNGIMNL